jgi:HK97 family phage prohead protease
MEHETSLELLAPPSIKDASCYDGADRPEFEIKAISEEGEFEGYGSVFGVKDLQDEIVERGAFKRTLKQKGGKFPFLYSHDHREPIGRIVEAAEDQKGLKVKGKLALGVSRANDTLVLMREKIIRSMSIGFRVVKDEWDRENGIRRLKEIDLWEISAVLFPANPRARIQRVKEIVPYQNLPLADAGRRWSASAAEKRARSWADATDTPTAKYRRAFLWYDREESDSFGSYKLQVADVVDDELVAIPRAIFAAAAALMGARGGVKIPPDDVPRVRAHVARYYKRLDRSPPWEGQSSIEEILGHVVDLYEYVDEGCQKDLRQLAQAEANSSVKPFAWLDCETPTGLEPIGQGLFPHLKEYLGTAAEE